MNQHKPGIYELITRPDEYQGGDEPQNLTDYHGQKTLKQKLELYIKAASQRNEPLDHILLFGPPGLGKTTLAHLIARELGVALKICSGPLLERTGDLVAILTGLKPRDILFIDEIHRMPIAIEEVLYGALERYKVDVIIGQGAGAKSLSIPLSPFTLIGATTQTGLLSAPLRSRFGISERLDFYTDQELELIVMQSAEALKLSISPDGALMLARCARGTPRVAKKLLRRVRDVAQITNNGVADKHIVKKTLVMLGIDQNGLTTIDHTILGILAERSAPLGLDTLACLVGEDRTTIEDVYEPFLLRMGYIEKTPRGRTVSHAYRTHQGQMKIE